MREYGTLTARGCGHNADGVSDGGRYKAEVVADERGRK